MKKLLSVLCMLALFQCSVMSGFAAEYDINVSDTQQIVVKGTAASNESVIVKILKSNNTSTESNQAAQLNALAFPFPNTNTYPISTLLNPLHDGIDDDLFGYTLNVGYGTADADGNYEVKIAVPAQGSDRVFMLIPNGGSLESTAAVQPIFFPSTDTINNAINAINGAANATTNPAEADRIQALQTAIETYDTTLGLNTAHATYKSSDYIAKKIAKACLDQRPSDGYSLANIAKSADTTSFKYHFNKALEFYTIQLEALAEINGADLTADGLKSILEAYDSVDGDFGLAYNVLGDYNGQTINYASKYATYDYVRVNNILLANSPYATMEAFKSAFEAAVPTTVADSPQGGGAAPNVIVPSTEIPQEQPEVVTPAITFNDIDHVSWAKSSIINLASKNIINGMGDGSFNPDGNVTREQVVKMLVEMFAMVSVQTTDEFVDVKQGEWYTPYVATASKLGIVNGISDTEFGIGLPVTRQDLATMVSRACKIFRITLDKKVTVSFTDLPDVATYAVAPVLELASAGIINGMGDGSFVPANNTTRAQVAVMLDRLYN